MIRFEQVTKSYKGGVTAVKELSLEIGKGEFVFWSARPARVNRPASA